MASLDTGGGDSGHKKGPGVKKAKKLSTRVDMTPMVDLGFLLITFFIFTTTMSTPAAMSLFMPKDTDKPDEMNKAKASGALTVMLGKANQVYYYEGELKPDGSNFTATSFDPTKGIRSVLLRKRQEMQKLGTLDDMVVVIKPNSDATYKNTVDMLDEMKITDVERFALVDITPNEDELVQATEKRSNIK